MKEDQTMSSFYRRRFMHILPPFICFLLLYSLLPLLWGGMTWEQSLNDLKLLPFNFPSMAGHLWFMYPLISLYIIIPVISPWLQKATAREELTFLGFFAFTTLIPWFHLFVSPELWGECFWNQFTAVLLVLVGDVVNGTLDFLHQQEVFMAHEADWYLQYMVYAAPFLLLVCCHMSSCLEATERSSSIQYNNDANHSIYQERCKFSL
jgi:fucose 4-O-acetylase-like acetyltransferase